MANQSGEVTDLPVRPGEDPWTAAEVDELRQELAEEVEQHQQALERAQADLKEILGNEQMGDPADVGAANFERDHEMTLAATASEMLAQTRSALEAIDKGTYGRCEECGEPIGKGRLQVYPRATLCMQCKQRQEKR